MVVTLLVPAKHVLETRSPHLSFMLLKEYWFKELYLGLKVTSSFDRTESYVRVIDGQVRWVTTLKSDKLRFLEHTTLRMT